MRGGNQKKNKREWKVDRQLIVINNNRVMFDFKSALVEILSREVHRSGKSVFGHYETQCFTTYQMYKMQRDLYKLKQMKANWSFDQSQARCS